MKNRIKILGVATVAVLAAGCGSVGDVPTFSGLSLSTHEAEGATDKNPVAISTKKSQPIPASVGPAKQVKGPDGTEGEVYGTPAKGSKFAKLTIGMPFKTVERILGEPDDAGNYLTAKAFIPMYFGNDSQRMEYVYKGQGRLVFAMGGVTNMGGSLIMIVNNPNEAGIR
jgi:hypothetical protein